MKIFIVGLACIATALAGVQDGAFVHLFEWSWSDVAQECEDFLSPAGYQGVQISPPMEHIQGDPWWTRYQPVSYKLQSRSGNETQFADMVSRCNKVGVAIIADAVINHMAASPPGDSAVGVAGTEYHGRSFQPYDYDAGMMHHSYNDDNSNCVVSDYNSAQDVQQCDLVELVDLDTENQAVRDVIGTYISSMHKYGIKGYRIDAAKHIQADSVKGIVETAPGGLYVFQEVIYAQGEPVTPEQYTSSGDVTEFRFGTNIWSQFKEGAQNTMQYMQNFGPEWGMLQSDSAVTFTDNHDTQRTASNVLTYKDGQYYDQANYFMLAHPYGHPKVMSSYYFHDIDQGPPSVPVHTQGGQNCGDDRSWVCEHRRTGIAHMAQFRLTCQGQADSLWQFDPNNANRLAFSRGTKGFFALNQDTSSLWEGTVSTDLPDGRYCNVISSVSVKDKSCDENQVYEVEGGRVDLRVDTLNAVALHVDAMA